jgi:hypothetical protein
MPQYDLFVSDRRNDVRRRGRAAGTASSGGLYVLAAGAGGAEPDGLHAVHQRGPRSRPRERPAALC